MQTTSISQIATSPELPVEQLYNDAVQGFKDTHAELMKLPQDPKEPLLPAEAMLRNLGVEVDNDYSFLINGAMGQMGTDVALGAMGLAGGGAISQGIDFASGLLMGYAEERLEGTEKKNGSKFKKAGATSMFKPVAAKPRVHQPAPKQPAATTSFFKKAQAKRKDMKIKSAEDRRKKLRSTLDKHMETIKELQAFKSCGVKYARRVTVPNGETGEAETYHVAVGDKPHMALSAKGKPLDVSMVQKPAYQAPALVA